MRTCKAFARICSLKGLLGTSFIVLMAISGILGFTLTYVQSQRSLHEVAEAGMAEAAYSVIVSLKARISTGHQVNRMESLYLLRLNLTLDNWVTAYFIWRPITIQNMVSASGMFTTSMAYWISSSPSSWFPLEYISLGDSSVTLVNFNNSVCRDPANFPGSNCSVPEFEGYLYNVNTMQPYFTRPLFLQHISGSGGNAGPPSLVFCKSSSKQQFSPGYTAVYPSPTYPTELILQINVEIANSAGNCVGQLEKNLALDFVNTLLLEVVNGNPLLQSEGRAFVFESSGYGLIGASHGAIYIQSACATCTFGVQYTRLHPNESTDPLIATAGTKVLQYVPKNGIYDPPTFQFDRGSQQYLHLGAMLTDEFGLSWMVSVVLSLTALFQDINGAAMRMLAITVTAIIALSVITSLLITYIVSHPLRNLSRAMEDVALMKLEHAEQPKSAFYEIALMQGFFIDMVHKLKEFRAFLPEAILDYTQDVLGADATDEEPEFERVETAAFPLGASRKRSTGPSSGTSSDAENSRVFEKKASRKSVFIRSPSVYQVGAISKRFISCLQVDIIGFHSSFIYEAMFSGVYSTLTDILVQGVQENCGMSNPMIGDKLVAVWNVKTVRAEHGVHCATAALRIQREIAKLVETQAERQFLGVRISCTAGHATFGSLGTQSTRSFTVISPCIPLGFALQKLCKLLPIGIACDFPFQQQIMYRFITRLVVIIPKPVRRFSVRPDEMTSGSSSTLPSTPECEQVFEILRGVNENQVTEWMYEIQQKEQIQSEQALFESAVRVVFAPTQGFAEAKQIFSAHLRQQPLDQLASWYVERGVDLFPRLLDAEQGLLVPFHLFRPSVTSLPTPPPTANTASRNSISSHREVSVSRSVTKSISKKSLESSPPLASASSTSSHHFGLGSSALATHVSTAFHAAEEGSTPRRASVRVPTEPFDMLNENVRKCVSASVIL